MAAAPQRLSSLQRGHERVCHSHQHACGCLPQLTLFPASPRRRLRSEGAIGASKKALKSSSEARKEHTARGALFMVRRSRVALRAPTSLSLLSLPIRGASLACQPGHTAMPPRRRRWLLSLSPSCCSERRQPRCPQLPPWTAAALTAESTSPLRESVLRGAWNATCVATRALMESTLGETAPSRRPWTLPSEWSQLSSSAMPPALPSRRPLEDGCTPRR